MREKVDIRVLKSKRDLRNGLLSLLKTKTFDKTLDFTDAQSIEVMGTNNSISLAGISSYISVNFLPNLNAFSKSFEN